MSLSNIHILYEGGGSEEDATREIEEKPEAYPESTMFGTLPAYGFFCRNVKGIQFNNVTVGFENEDKRPAFVFDYVNDAWIQGCKVLQGTECFLSLKGNSKQIGFIGNNTVHAEQKVIMDESIGDDELSKNGNVN